MMKLTLWVQFTLKKSNVDAKNLLDLKDPTCQKLCLFISVLLKISFHKSCHAARLNSVQIMVKVMILKQKNLEIYKRRFARLPLRKISRELNVGSQVSLTLSLHQFYLTEENLKLFLQFKKYSSEGLGSQIQYWMIWLSPIINYGTPFPNNNLLLSLRSCCS